MNKSFIAFITMVMVIPFTALFAGGRTAGGGKTAVTGAGVLPIVNEKVTLTAFAAQQGIVENLDTNYATRWLEEKTNIHLAWEAVPSGEAREKFTIMANSGGVLPDIIMPGDGITLSMLYSYGSQGVFLPLNNLIDTYGVEVKRLWGIEPETKKQMTSPDGNIYAVGNYYRIKHVNYLPRVYVDTEWLRNLNLPYPTTTEELYNTLVAFRDRDPNGNGRRDEVPFTGSNSGNTIIQWIVNSFIYYGDGIFNTRNGRLQQVVTAPEFREALRFIRRLYSEGLLDNQAFTQSIETLRQLVNGGDQRAGVIGVMTYSMFTDPYSEAAKTLEMLPPVAGPQGLRLAAYSPSSWSPKYFLSKDCKNPEAAFRLGDYLSSEEAQTVLYQGEEGVDWVNPSPGEIAINGKPARIRVINSLPSLPMQNKGWMWMAPQVDVDYLIDGSYFDPSDPWYIEYRLYKGVTETMEPYRPTEGWIPPLTYTEDELIERTPIWTEIDNFLRITRLQFITGELSLDRDWDSYLRNLNSLNIRRLQEIDQAALDRYNN